MKVLKEMSVSAASLYSKSGQVNSNSAGTTFLYIKDVRVSFIDTESLMIGMKSPDCEIGFFEFDYPLIGTLQKLHQGRERINGLFAIVSDDMSSFGMPDGFKARLIGIERDTFLFIPKTSSFFEGLPTEQLSFKDITIIRECPITNPPEKRAAASPQKSEFDQWLLFFKTPTREWGQQKEERPVCDCGAKYTSFPDVHLQMCRSFYRNFARKDPE